MTGEVGQILELDRIYIKFIYVTVAAAAAVRQSDPGL